MSAARRKKVMIWFEGHLGAGDAKLSFNLANGLAIHGYDVYLVSSSVERWQHLTKPNPAVHIMDLPALERRQDQHYYTPDNTRFPDDTSYVAKRSKALTDAFEHINPDVVVTQGWPIGRNPFDEEMLALMGVIEQRAVKPALVAYPIDVNFVTTREDGRQQRKAQFVEQMAKYDALLIPGVKTLDYTAAIPQLSVHKDKIHYAGYSVDPFDTTPAHPQHEVLVCSGGGWHDSDLIFYLAAIKSRKHSELKDDVWRIKVSRKLCSDAMYDQIIAAAREEDPTGHRVLVEAADDKFQQQMVDAKLVIVRAGYNTLTETVYAGKHAVSIPRPYKGFDREQQARAEAFEKAGYLRMIKSDELEHIVQSGDYGAMGHVIDQALHDDIAKTPPLNTQCAENAATLFSSLIEQKQAMITNAYGSPLLEHEIRRDRN